MNLEKLKLVARQHEGREEWRKAIDVYLKAIEAFESGEAPVPDLSLYNRVGDLYMKINSTGSAVQSYERAVDLYSDQGFANNAIALCGKILRVNPGRVPVYLKLAKLHAMKNVVVEAKKNLLEYLDRMNSSGHRDEALQEVTAFADRFASNEDIRTMLTELLRAASRRHDASGEHLERLAEDLEAGPPASGGESAPAPTQDRPRTRPSISPKPGDLVFLDTGMDFHHLGIRTPRRRGEPSEEPESAGVPSDEGVETASVDDAEPFVAESAQEATDLVGASADVESSEADADAEDEEFIIQRHVYDDVPETHDPSLAEGLDLEPTTVDEVEEGPVDRLDGLMVDSASELRSNVVEPVEGLEDLGIEHGLGEEDAAPPEEDLIQPESGLEGVEVSASDSLVAPTSSQADELAIEEPEADMRAETATPVADTAAEGPTIADLEDRILDDPDDPQAHRALGEALIAEGEADRGLEELELALQGYEAREDWGHATDVIGGLLRLDPNCIAYYQKGVELAFRTDDRARLLDAYLALGDVLVRVGALEKAAAVYGRVLEHDPGNMMAQAALESLAPVEEAAAPTAPPAPAVTPSPPAAPPKEFVHLGDLVVDRPSKDARIRIDRTQPTGNEEQDFAEILQEFRRGIDENIEIEDYQSHYDLGIAFKEMGLLDEAIAEFQKALRAPQGRLPTSEALGVSFFEKHQYPVAEAILKRAVDALPGLDDEKIGLLYWLGRAREEQGKAPEALACYQRAMAVDISFMDIGERVPRLEESLSR